jgi:membrane carboxypeptidase/penicillin-binding protein
VREKEIAVKAEIEKYRIDTDAQVKLTLAQMQGETSFGLESHRAALTADKETKANEDKATKTVAATQQIVEQQTEQIAGMLESVLQVVEGNLAVLKAQKRIVRGKTGRAEAIELVMPDGSKVVTPLLRDESGRIAGTA